MVFLHGFSASFFCIFFLHVFSACFSACFSAINYMSTTMGIRVDFNFESVLCVLKSRKSSLVCFSRDSSRGASPEQGRRRVVPNNVVEGSCAILLRV